MEEMNKLFNSIDDKALNVAKLGEVVKFDADKMTADIQPLPSSDNAMVLNVPIMCLSTKDFFISTPLQAKDLVLLVFLDNDMDAILNGEDRALTERTHDISDCICIGGISRESIKGDSKNLLISNRGGSGKITISPKGDIEIKGSTIKLEADRIDLN